MRSERALLLVRLTPVLVGYGWGAGMDYPGRAGPSGFLVIALIAITTMVYSLVVALRSQDSQTSGLLFVLILFAVMIVMTDPFMWNWIYHDVMRGVVLLLPFIVLIGYFARHGNWAATVGVGLFLTACIANLIFNTRFADFRKGFLSVAYS